MARFCPTSAPTNWLSSGGNGSRDMPELTADNSPASGAGVSPAEGASRPRTEPDRGRDARLTTRPRLPVWLRRRLPATDSFAQTRALLDELKLHTVCESARCPNHWECWSKGTATFMIAGDRCTRACGFCAVTTAKPFALEADEPQRVAEATRRMGLKHVVITAVARDDLPDGGADHFRRTIEAVRALNPGTVIEVLTPDFNDRNAAIEAVLAANPHIFNHNLETVRRL